MNLLDLLTLWPPFSSTVAIVVGDAGSGTDTALATATLYAADAGAGASAYALAAALAIQTDTGTGGSYAAYSDATSVRAPATGILVVVQTQSFADEGAAPVLVPVYTGGFCERGILVKPR